MVLIMVLNGFFFVCGLEEFFGGLLCCMCSEVFVFELREYLFWLGLFFCCLYLFLWFCLLFGLLVCCFVMLLNYVFVLLLVCIGVCSEERCCRLVLVKLVFMKFLLIVLLELMVLLSIDNLIDNISLCCLYTRILYLMFKILFLRKVVDFDDYWIDEEIFVILCKESLRVCLGRRVRFLDMRRILFSVIFLWLLKFMYVIFRVFVLLIKLIFIRY